MVKKAKLHDAFSTLVTYTDNDIEKQLHHIAVIFIVSEYDDSLISTDMELEDSLGAQYYTQLELSHFKISPLIEGMLKQSLL